MKYKNIITPKTGEKISFDKNGKMIVPDHVVVPFIEGDGIGTDITPATIKVVDHAVKTAYGENKKIEWMEVYCGEKSVKTWRRHLDARRNNRRNKRIFNWNKGSFDNAYWWRY